MSRHPRTEAAEPWEGAHPTPKKRGGASQADEDKARPKTVPEKHLGQGRGRDSEPRPTRQDAKAKKLTMLQSAGPPSARPGGDARRAAQCPCTDKGPPAAAQKGTGTQAREGTRPARESGLAPMPDGGHTAIRPWRECRKGNTTRHGEGEYSIVS